VTQRDPVVTFVKVIIYTDRLYVPERGITMEVVTIILNHLRGWGGKPIGSPIEIAGMPKNHTIIGPGFFVFKIRFKEVMTHHD
jgi:hypothetical protein